MKSLNWFSAYLIRAALGVIESTINGITNESVRRALLLSLKPVKQVITVLTDGDERNDEQIAKVFKDFAGGELPDFAETELAILVAKIKDENTRAVVDVLSDPVVDVLRLLTDANKDNETQIKERLQELIADPKSLQVLILNIAIPVAGQIKDDKVREFLLEFLKNILQGGGVVIEG